MEALRACQDCGGSKPLDAYYTSSLGERARYVQCNACKKLYNARKREQRQAAGPEV